MAPRTHKRLQERTRDSIQRAWRGPTESPMLRWTGLAPWKFEFPFPGSLTSTFLRGDAPSRPGGSAHRRREADQAPFLKPGGLYKLVIFIQIAHVPDAFRRVRDKTNESYYTLPNTEGTHRVAQEEVHSPVWRGHGEPPTLGCQLCRICQLWRTPPARPEAIPVQNLPEQDQIACFGDLI